MSAAGWALATVVTVVGITVAIVGLFGHLAAVKRAGSLIMTAGCVFSLYGDAREGRSVVFAVLGIIAGVAAFGFSLMGRRRGA